MGLKSFGTGLNTAVFGASGGIGSAFVTALAAEESVTRVHAVSRGAVDFASSKICGHSCDPLDEAALGQAVALMTEDGPLHLAVIALGILHGDGIAPEKTWRHVDADVMGRVLAVNTIAPTLIAKHVLPGLAKGRKTALAALSARVGSISDNRLGGWVSYRASKAALNMVIRTFSIELARVNREAMIVGLHPGTVETALSDPFRQGVPEGKLFTPEHSVEGMLATLDAIGPDASGKIFDYAGVEIFS